MTFSDKVKHVRATLMITQMELAERLGVAYQTVNRWESKGMEPKFLQMQKFESFCKENKISFGEEE